MTPAGIEPTTFRFVAQHLNHCATAVPGTVCSLAESRLQKTVWLQKAVRTVDRRTEIHPWEEERCKNGVKTETLVGSGLFAYPGRSCYDAEISKHTNTVRNIL